jgi:hypothetical protein
VQSSCLNIGIGIGMVRYILFDMRSKRIYVGLLDRIISFCQRHDYTYKFVDNEYYGTPYEINDGISYEGVKDYMQSICNHSPRKYQVEGVYDALKHNRKLLISPTASGKSLMIYSLVRYYVGKSQKNSFSCSNDISCRADV